MEETISLQEIFAVIRKRLVLIFTTMLLGVGVAAVLTFMVIVPKYSSSSQLLVTVPVTVDGVKSNVNDVNFNLQMIATYKQLITTGSAIADATHDVMVKDYSFKGTAKDIQSMLQVVQEQNSQMFSIKATTTDPYIAQGVAITVAEVFKKEVKGLLPSVDGVAIISDAPLNLTPVSPNNKLNLLIGAVLGVLLGIGIAFLLELLDTTVKTERFVEDTLDLPILGRVSQMDEKQLRIGTEAILTLRVLEREEQQAETKSEEVTQTRRSRNRL